MLYLMIGSLILFRKGDLIKNSQAVKKDVAPKKAMVKKDVKSKVAQEMAVMVG